MLLSLLYRLVRCLPGLLAVLVRPDLSKDVELLVLRHEAPMYRSSAWPACPERGSNGSWAAGGWNLIPARPVHTTSVPIGERFFGQ